MEPFRNLLRERLGEAALKDIEEQGGPQWRDHLLYLDPLNTEWVKKVNQVCLYKR